jgi:hypothetical protein
MLKSPVFLIMLLAGLGLSLSPAWAQGSKGTLIAEGQYFSVYADPPVDAYSVSSKLNYEYLVFGHGLAKGASGGHEQILSRSIDGLYLEVSDIIDIHVYSFKGIIRVLPDKQSLASMIKQEYNRDFSERSLYYLEKNTIYISQEDMTLGMLGHEMAHAIISNFFEVPPPPKTQEILSGYVEYTLNKTHGS